jgi:hypothetical protein
LTGRIRPFARRIDVVTDELVPAVMRGHSLSTSSVSTRIVHQTRASKPIHSSEACESLLTRGFYLSQPMATTTIEDSLAAAVACSLLPCSRCLTHLLYLLEGRR